MQKRNLKFAREFTRRLEARMTQLDISKDTLIRHAGLPKPTVYELFSGTIVPRADTVLKIARALNVSTDDLINFDV